jgi:glutathione-regulated potassium-efflux system ancillary protein KefG
VSSKRRVLIVFAHPALQKSRVNARLMRAVAELPGVTFHDLYEAYPDFDIDVVAEKQLLLEHPIVVLQHPFYWYAAPALLKEWIDLVFEHGWAYGRGGTALRGKLLVSAITTGGREDAYRPDGNNRYTIKELLAPFDQTAHLCGMDYLSPFVVHGTHALERADIEAFARDYARFVVALRDGRLDVEAARGLPRVNSDLDRVIEAG